MELFDVRKGEVRAVALSLLLSFFIGIPRVFTLAAANDLFMAEHGPANLPWAYASGAFVLAGVGYLYVRVGQRLSPRVLGLVVFALLAGANLVAYAALRPLGAKVVSFALIIAVEAEVTLTSITFWSAAYRTFTLPQARRLFGLISAGEVIPTIAGGLALHWLVQDLGVAQLLLVSVAGHTLSAAAFLAVDRAGRRGEDEEAAPLAGGEAQASQRRYIRALGAVIALNVFVYYAVDNAFYHGVHKDGAHAGELAAFLGDFFVALGVASLLFKLFLSGRWRAWLGLRSVLLSVPGVLIVLAVVVLITQGPLHTADGALAAIALLKLAERVLIEAVHVPAYHALLLPLPPELRRTAQASLEGIVAHAATLAGGGVLVALNLVLDMGVVGLTAVTLGALVLWAGLAVGLSARYREVLRTALAERRLATGALQVADSTTLQLLEEGLESPHPPRVIWTLHLLRELRHPRIEALAARLVEHPSPVVVEVAARLLEKEGTAASAAALAARIQRGAPPRALARLLRALSATAPDGAVEVLRQHLHHPAPLPASAAIVGLFRHGGTEGAHLASPRLVVLARSPDAETRVAAARAAASIRSPQLARLITRLLRDPAPEVQQAALRAAGRVADPGTWPFVVDALAQRSLRRSAAAALVEGGPGAMGALLEAYHRPGQFWRVRQRVLEIAALIGGPEADALVHAALAQPDLGLRRAALVALDDPRAKTPAPSPDALDAALEDDLNLHARLRGAARAVRGWAQGDLLTEALERELQRATERLLLILERRYPGGGLSEARRFATSSRTDDRDLAAELVEACVPAPRSERLQPVLHPDPPASPPARGAAPPPGLAEVLRGLLAAAEGRRMRWLTTCVHDALEQLDLPQGTVDLGDNRVLLERVRHLLRSELLRGLGGLRLADLALRATERHLAEHQPLVAAGAVGDALFIVQEGLLLRSGGGERDALLGVGYQTDPLALLRPTPAPHTLVAASASRVLELRAEHLEDVVDDDPDAAWLLLEGLCVQLREGQATAAGLAPGPEAHHPGPREEGRYYDLLQRMVSLRAVPPFDRVEEPVLLAVAEAAREAALSPGQVILTEGEQSTAMFILVEGTVSVTAAGASLATIAAPSIFGELSAIAPGPRSASVTAQGPGRALVLSRSTLYHLTRAQPEVLRVLLDRVLDRMRPAAPRPVTSGETTDDTLLPGGDLTL
jgi:CRP/FNR family cyclic AMP-dependent transcriptional regulator